MTEHCIMDMLKILLLSVTVSLQPCYCAIPLYVAGLLELSNHWWSTYGNFLPILFQSAADEIANRTDILNGYKLKFVYADTQGKEGLACKVLCETMAQAPPKIAVFGPQMSDEIKLVGTVTPFYNTMHMNYIAKTSSTKDRSIYSTLYSTNYIEDDLNPLRIALMKYFGWTRVATLVFNEDIFTSQIEEFHQSLVHNSNNLTLITSGIITTKNNISDHITRLKQYDSRIIIGAFRSTIAGDVFCEVYKQGLYGQKYTWILTGASLYEHWVKDIKETDLPCARKNLYAATNYMITLNQFPLSTDNHTTLSGRTPAEYDTWINKLQVEANTTNLLTRNHPWIYDSVWALALGLNNSLKYLNGSKLEDFNYGRYDIKNSIAKGMDEVKFEGVSGHVSFNNGRRIGPAFIQLNIGDNRTNVGRFDSLTGNITWYINPTCLWPGYIIPKDGSKTITENVKSSIAAVTVIGLMASVGFIVAFGLLIFNITFRKNRHIKMSSPRINNLIICGGMIMYLSVYISIAEYMSLVDNGVLCMLSTWSTSIGFTIAFGALFSKTWRVHVLFHNNSIRKKVIKDVQLLAVCVVLLAVDIMILVPWTFFYSLERNKIVVLVEDENTDVSRQEVYYVCSSSTKIYWIGVQYVYKGLLLAFGTFLAWETRKIEVLALNDSKLIGFCVYNIVIICFIGVPIHHLLREDQVTMRFVLINCLVIFCTTLVLCILFIPKLKFRNETESIKFVASLKGKISTAVKNSTIKAIASKANIGNRTGGKDQIYRENESTQNEHIQEHSAYFEDRTLTPNKETRGTMHSFADETSTAV